MVSGNPAFISLTDLVHAATWQRLQESFARVLNIPMRTIGLSHELLVPPSWPASLTGDTVMALLGAGEELDQLLPLEQLPRELTSVTTAIGATYAAVPLRAASDLIVAYVVLGPIIVGVREDESEFRCRISQSGRDAAALWPILLSLRLYSFNSLRAVMTLIEEVSNSLAGQGYRAKTLEAQALSASAAAGRTREAIGETAARALLEAAMAVSEADGGSVMTADPLDGCLRIRAAEGLSDRVVQSTAVPAGEGLCGLALRMRETLLIDEAASDLHIRNRMQRHEIISSLVFPIFTKGLQDPVGVLNLRSTTPGKLLTPHDRERVQYLVNLAVAAAGPRT